MRKQVIDAIAELHTGQLEAVIDYPSSRSRAKVRFDLGDSEHPPRFAMTTTYEGTEATQTIERITIGSQSWQREANTGWQDLPTPMNVWEQMRPFLPNSDALLTAEVVESANQITLRWYDTALDTQVIMAADAATGIPRQLRQIPRTTGAAMTVTYIVWNGLVEITPPQR